MKPLRRLGVDLVRLEVPEATADIVTNRVEPLLPRDVRVYWNRTLLDAVILAAYVQGAMDALVIAETHPELLAKTEQPSPLQPSAYLADPGD